MVHGRRTRDNRLMLKEERFTWNIRKNCFTLRTAKRWNKLARVLVLSACFVDFKTPLYKALSWV